MSNLTTSNRVDSFMQQTMEALSATTALAINKCYTGAISTRTVTLPSAASPNDGAQILFWGTAAAETTITFPSNKVRQVGGTGYLASVTFPIGNVAFILTSDGTDFYLADSSVNLTNATLGRLTFDASASNMCGGQFTLGVGGTASVSNTAITSDSIVTVTLRTSSGTRAGAPDIVPTDGVGFVATGGSSDRSTYNYSITYIDP